MQTLKNKAFRVSVHWGALVRKLLALARGGFTEILDQVIREKDFAHQTKLFCLEQYNGSIVAEPYYGENLSLYFKNGTNLFEGKERFKENNYE